MSVRAVKKITTVSNNPFSIEILSPKVGAMVSWKLENDNSTNIVGYVGTVSVFADPLIGAEFTIDLIAAGTILRAAFEIEMQWWIFSYSKTLELEAEPLLEEEGFQIGRAKLI